MIFWYAPLSEVNKWNLHALLHVNVLGREKTVKYDRVFTVNSGILHKNRPFYNGVEFPYANLCGYEVEWDLTCWPNFYIANSHFP